MTNPHDHAPRASFSRTERAMTVVAPLLALPIAVCVVLLSPSGRLHLWSKLTGKRIPIR